MDMFTWEPGKARLDKQGKVNAWTAGHSDQSQWLQVRCYLMLNQLSIVATLEIRSVYCWRGGEQQAAMFLQTADFYSKD